MDPKIEVVYEACFGKREYSPCLAKPLPMPARAKVKWGTWKMETILPRVNRYIEMMQNLNTKKWWVLVCNSIQLKDVIITDTCPFKSAHTNKSISWILSQTYLGTPSMLSPPPSLQALIILGVSWEYCPHNQGSGLNIQRRELYPRTIEIPTGWKKLHHDHWLFRLFYFWYWTGGVKTQCACSWLKQ